MLLRMHSACQNCKGCTVTQRHERTYGDKKAKNRWRRASEVTSEVRRFVPIYTTDLAPGELSPGGRSEIFFGWGYSRRHTCLRCSPDRVADPAIRRFLLWESARIRSQSSSHYDDTHRGDGHDDHRSARHRSDRRDSPPHRRHTRLFAGRSNARRRDGRRSARCDKTDNDDTRRRGSALLLPSKPKPPTMPLLLRLPNQKRYF